MESWATSGDATAGARRRDRGPAPARVPRATTRPGVAARRRRRASPSDKRAGKLANLEKALARAARCRRRRPASGTPAGPPTARPTDVNAHPHLGRDGRVARRPQRHHRELRRAARRARGRRASSCVSETDTEVAAHLLEPRARRRRRPDRGDAAGRAAGSRARSPWSPSHADGPDARRRRPPQLARWWSASARARTSSAPTSPRSSSTPARRSSSARTRSSRSPATASTVTDFDGAPAEGTALPRRLGRSSAAEKGGYDWFMRKEIARAAAGRRRHAARPASTRDGRLLLDEMRISDEELRDVDKIIIVACGTAVYAGMVAKYAIEHWTRIPCEVELAREFRYRDPILDRDTLVVAISQSGETMDTLMALRHAREQRRQGAGDLQHQRLDDPARVRRGALHPRRPRDRRSPRPRAFLDPARRLLPARRSTSPRCAAPSTATRSPRSSTSCDADARRTSQTVLDDARSRSTSWPRSLADAHVGAVPRPARRLPGRARGRAQAQGARLHPRRGLRRRRAQARPDRADRGGPAGLLRRAAPRAATSCTTRCVSNIQEIRARGARTIVLAEEGDEDVAPYADDVIRLPAGARRCCSRWSPSCRCRSSPASWPPPRATTSTSRATWPSPSRSSRPAPR